MAPGPPASVSSAGSRSTSVQPSPIAPFDLPLFDDDFFSNSDIFSESDMALWSAGFGTDDPFLLPNASDDPFILPTASDDPFLLPTAFPPSPTPYSPTSLQDPAPHEDDPDDKKAAVQEQIMLALSEVPPLLALAYSDKPRGRYMILKSYQVMLESAKLHQQRICPYCYCDEKLSEADRRKVQ